MHIKNLFLGPIFFLIFLAIANVLKKKLVKDEIDEYFYFKALLLKFFGVIFFAFIYYYYYNGGDSIGYFTWAERFASYMFEDTSNAFTYLFTNNKEAFVRFKYSEYLGRYNYILNYNSREAFFIKITTVINLFSLNSYLSTSFAFALIAFIGNWLLYRTFSDLFPSQKRVIGWACLFIPSVAFWGSGILKDTLTFASLCVMIYCLYKGVINREKPVRNIIILLIAGYLCISLKAYIVVAFIPGAALWISNEYKKKIDTLAIRVVITPLLILLTIGSIALIGGLIGDSLGRFSAESFDKTVKDFQSWHKVASGDEGSGYDLGVSGTSVGSLIQAFPKSVNVTYFRPYLWEAGNPVVLMAALESTFFFFFFLYMFFIKGAVFRFLKATISHPSMQMALIFILIFGFVVGFTSYNFGALSRYKVPAMPIFSVFLAICSGLLDSKSEEEIEE